MLSTIAQLMPDGRTVVANDLEMGDIQKAVAAPGRFEGGSALTFDGDGTVIGSTDTAYPGSNLSLEIARAAAHGLFEADAALYRAKEGRNGGFARFEE